MGTNSILIVFVAALYFSEASSINILELFGTVCANQVLEANLQTGDLSITVPHPETGITTTTANCGKGDNLLLETEAYFYACLGEKPPFISGQQGMRALAVVEEICQRIEQNS